MFRKQKPEKELSQENQGRLLEAGKQAWIAKSIFCIIYAYVGDVRTEIFHRSIPAIKRKFDYKDASYLLITTKDKVKIRRAPWYSLGTQYIAVLEFEEGDPMPISHSKSDLKSDAYGLNRVMSKASRDTLLPSADSMLMFALILMIFVVLICIGILGYVLSDPNGAQNLRGAFTPKAQQETPTQ